jgi:hypothetical protein
LFPQALVMTGAGFALLDDVLGDGFALIAPPGTPPQMLADLRPSEVGKLPIRTVAVLDREDASPVEAPNGGCAGSSRRSRAASFWPFSGPLPAASGPLRGRVFSHRGNSVGAG